MQLGSVDPALHGGVLPLQDGFVPVGQIEVPRQDDGDVQKEYNLHLTCVELATGLEFWQKRVHVGKLVDKKNVMN